MLQLINVGAIAKLTSDCDSYYLFFLILPCCDVATTVVWNQYLQISLKEMKRYPNENRKTCNVDFTMKSNTKLYHKVIKASDLLQYFHLFWEKYRLSYYAIHSLIPKFLKIQLDGMVKASPTTILVRNSWAFCVCFGSSTLITVFCVQIHRRSRRQC